MPSTTTPLMEAVLNTNELLCRILQYLPLRDLLLARRVSRRWQHVISTTPSLQSALYFREPPSTSVPHAPTPNPLLASTFPQWFLDLRTVEPSYSWPIDQPFAKLAWAKRPDAFRRADASWRKMLVMQPPVQTFVVEERVEDRGADFSTRRTYKLGSSGLRMGLFYDFAASWCSEAVDFVGGVRWEMFDYKEGRRESSKNERDDRVVLILYHSERFFLQNLGKMPISKIHAGKPKDFELFRSLGAEDLGKLEFESKEDSMSQSLAGVHL